MPRPAVLAVPALAAAALLAAGGGGAAATAPTKPVDQVRISAAKSRFGTMLWGPRRQAVYVFQRDSRNRTRCHGECARAWPPVLTKGRPRAGRGVRAKLLGSIRRPDGTRQVTYRGRPLYYYAHERAGQVLCHDVDLHGGLWWVIGPDGRRRP